MKLITFFFRKELENSLDRVKTQFFEDLKSHFLEGVEETGKGKQATGTDIIGLGTCGSIFDVNYKGKVYVGKRLHSIFFSNQVEEGMRVTLTKFYEEIKLISKLQHDNIVEFIGLYHSQHHDDDEQAVDNSEWKGNGTSLNVSLPVLVMEKMECSLTQCIEKHKPGCVPRNIGILCDVAKGLIYLHEGKVPLAHRDLSSNNILLTSKFHAKIADFGAARLLEIQEGWNPSVRLTHCPRATIFMPPEALQDPPQYTVAVDVFSFGCVIIHLFCGQWPEPADQTKGGKVITELQRRKKWISMMGDDHYMLPIISQCLDKKRPTSRHILYLLQKTLQ